MIIRFVQVESALPEEEVLAIAEKRAEEFRAVPGLIQKYYVRLNEPNCFGGIYLWDSMDSLKAFRETPLAKSIPAAYKAVSAPKVEVFEGLFALREGRI